MVGSEHVVTCWTFSASEAVNKKTRACGSSNPEDPLIISAFLHFLSAGEIGGNLGLFLGCSILTIFEFIDFAIYLCRTRNKKKS